MSLKKEGFISKRKAIHELGISRHKLDQGIKDGTIAAIYPGVKLVKVCVSDVQRAITSAPDEPVPPH